MKKLLLVLALLTFMVPSVFAQSSIGMYSDQAMTSCDAMFPVYVQTPIHFVANMDPAEMTACISVQFKVTNTPDAAVAISTPAWNTDLVIGEWSTDIALAFATPLSGPAGYLGRVDILALSDLGADYELEVVPADSQIDILIVNADGAVELPALGGMFTINCSGSCSCTTATGQATWGSIKALY